MPLLPRDGVKFSMDFNPRPHAESDPVLIIGIVPDLDFNPRPHAGDDCTSTERPDQSKNISIHAPHGGSDDRQGRTDRRGRNFNPRSPCGERQQGAAKNHQEVNFYSHSPCGERRTLCGTALPPTGNFYPRSPWGSDRATDGELLFTHEFQSTLAMRGTMASRSLRPVPPPTYFYPCSPCGERHGVSAPVIVDNAISIHAPHAGSDMCSAYHRQRWYDFYPRSPCGERLQRHTIAAVHLHFYPRSPCGERLPIDISHHRPRNFYPRSPCGERRHGDHQGYGIR